MNILQFSETAANLVAFVVFAIIGYLAILIVLSVPKRIRELKKVKMGLERFQKKFQEISRQINEGFAGPESINWVFEVVKFDGPKHLDPIRMLKRVLTAWSKGDKELAAAEAGIWSRKLGQGHESHFLLATIAVDFGMFFTVIGGLFAFSNIGQMNEPFEAFGALALAMITTAVGLIVSIAVRMTLGSFQSRLRSTLQLANEVMVASVRIGVHKKHEVKQNLLHESVNGNGHLPAEDENAFDEVVVGVILEEAEDIIDEGSYGSDAPDCGYGEGI